ncbi:unnamed protein product, partial [Rotaria sp. Silwood1]
ISTLTRPIIRKPRSLSVPPVIQQPFIQTTNQQIRQVTPTYIPAAIRQPFIQATNQQVRPTYIPPAIQPSISSYIPQT